ncbi:MAG TPA: hypothetical protein VIP10_01310, partial [Burkholderiaceae bacterium]
MADSHKTNVAGEHMIDNRNVLRSSAIGLACAAIFATGAAQAASDGAAEADRQAVATANQLLAVLRQYERAPSTQRS